MHRSMLLALAPMKDVTDLAFLSLMKILQAAPFTDSSWAMNRNTWQGMRRS